jgi:aryl-alcohol dehydrogenase-like predicted oxidoreductase
MCEPPYSILVRGIEADVLPACQRYQMGVITRGPLAGGWLSGRYRLGADLPVTSRSQRMPRGFDLSDPGNRQKLEAADKLADLAAEAGLSLIHLALGFVLSHPAVTSAIIGPRTMEQLEGQLGAPDQLRADVLDRIDEIVPPGTNLNPADRSYEPLALLDAGLRRRN